MSRILIATQNKGKIKEIKALLSDLNLELVIPSQVGLNLNVTEDGATYQENAKKKAQLYAEASRLLTLADDSGLEVSVLGGQPGIYSARFSNIPEASDADRRRYLLDQLRNHPRPWLAQFVCVVVIYQPGGKPNLSQGICHGEIIPEERGNQGFGYDPIFKVKGTGYTMAELSMDMKNRISHRALAIRSIKPNLVKLTTTK